MRRKVLEGNCYIPNKLIRSLSNPQNNQSTSKVDNKRRVEKETVIRIENDVLKRDGYDSIQLKAAVIQASPGPNPSHIIPCSRSNLPDSHYRIRLGDGTALEKACMDYS